ncbi:MAG: deoxyribodipyrimidine photo-lyase [Verrucomicrobia bacterium]|nr:deoxyribodipyrimidine photo-lyase [Verrucomicrobiota bacterium]MDA1065626.1 deoxyribodipyrimidine photo-lyase [Verrucomicrobiota bacterium]
MLAVHWFRRDLRLEDNRSLQSALSGDLSVLPIFIFDQNILTDLPIDDARLSFIYKELTQIQQHLKKCGSGILAIRGDPHAVWSSLLTRFEIRAVHWNKDYEPYARDRDKAIRKLLEANGVEVNEYKDQVIFEEGEIVKKDGKPYTVFTPYKKKWLAKLEAQNVTACANETKHGFFQHQAKFPTLKEIGFLKSNLPTPKYDISRIEMYGAERNLPAANSTSRLGPHLRFGTVSIRQVLGDIYPRSELFLSELIWREFFMQILFHFPGVVSRNFRSKYDGIRWRNNETEFEAWCRGETGYPLVDAGMRQLNQTGFMHNRVRMVVASFLCKHLLIDWCWGEAYFAEKLLDYELSSNNGNWQWAAGTGCDAAPYFRVFNPATQQEKFDPQYEYIKRWLLEYGTDEYSEPMVDHKFARERAIATYKKGIDGFIPCD